MFVESFALFEDRRLDVSSVDRNRFSAVQDHELQKDVHTAFDGRTVDGVPIAFNLDERKDGGDDMIFDWGSDNMLDEEIQTSIPYWGDSFVLRVNTILQGI